MPELAHQNLHHVCRRSNLERAGFASQAAREQGGDQRIEIGLTSEGSVDLLQP